MAHSKKVAIVGGGISGLSAAFRILTDSPKTKIVLFESNYRLGGVLSTRHVGDYLIEESADMFSIEPDAALTLGRELGLEPELLKTQPVKERAFVSYENGIAPVPEGFALMQPNRTDSFVQTPLISEAGKLRFRGEENIAPRMETIDESLKSFAVRRFGNEVFEQLIQPLASGIYSADPDRLSMHATMMRFVEMEREHGSLIAAGRAKKTAIGQDASGARYGMFRTPAAGFQSWVDRLRERIERHSTRAQIRTQTKVVKVSEADRGWQLDVLTETGEQSLEFDGIILATSAKISGSILQATNATLATQLNAIENASMTIVAMGVDNSQLKSTFEGFGIVVPAIENRELIAISFSSNKFTGRCADGKTLLRFFIGGALSPHSINRTDNELITIAREELDRLIGWKQDQQDQPEFTQVIRWPNAMPQYHVGHLDRVAAIDAGVHTMTGLELAGNSYHGVGIPACIVSGFTAAQRILTVL